MHYRISDPTDVRDLADQIAAWTAAGNPKANDWAEQPAAPSADAVWTADAEWVVPPAPTFTAEQWLEQNGLGGNRQPTLIYLKLQLQAAGRVSGKLSALESYLNTILASYAQDQSAKSDWPNSPYSFEEAVADAVQFVAPSVPENL